MDNVVIWHLYLLYCSCRTGDQIQSGFKQILLLQGNVLVIYRFCSYPTE